MAPCRPIVQSGWPRASDRHGTVRRDADQVRPIVNNPAASGRTFTADDAWLFNSGAHTRADEVLGAHWGTDGTAFRVWAPAATSVDVIGEFNGWRPGPMSALAPDPSGVWRGVLSRVEIGDVYKYRIVDADGQVHEKADPFGFAHEEPPRTGSVVADLSHDWGDEEWMRTRGPRLAHDAPVSIYEVHLGSWRYEPGGYRALAVQLAEYAAKLGFTHVELLPITEHPFYGSWGYQTTGYFAPSARYGGPADFKAFVDTLHQAGIGVILDWVPSHFPTDAHGLARFDGTSLYEHEDPRLGHHPDWDSAIFNYDRSEVRSFLLSSAHFWVREYHIDGIRVDAVASMLYLDYSRGDGEWLPNEFGGNENLGAVLFLQDLNRTLYAEHPGIQVIAEESTAWPGVTRPVDAGGLGFGYKWDMGWMHDTLQFLGRDAIHRGFHHGELTFRSGYAGSENYVLPLSHDEVVHGKGSLLAKSPGDRWQQLAGLRLMLGYQWTTPGKKLLFMGGEIGQASEWRHEAELDWGILGDPDHSALQRYVAALNCLYQQHPPLHLGDCDTAAFEWIVGDDAANSTLVFVRWGPERPALVAINFTPVPRHGYRVGVPLQGRWEPVLQSDAIDFGGSGVTIDAVDTDSIELHGHAQSVELSLGPLAVAVFVPTDRPDMED